MSLDVPKAKRPLRGEPEASLQEPSFWGAEPVHSITEVSQGKLWVWGCEIKRQD